MVSMTLSLSPRNYNLNTQKAKHKMGRDRGSDMTMVIQQVGGRAGN